MYTVFLAFVDVLAISDRCELLVRHLLKGFRTADVAGIRIDQKKRFDFRHSSDDSPYRDQFSKVDSFDLTHGHGGTFGQRSEIEVARMR